MNFVRKPTLVPIVDKSQLRITLRGWKGGEFVFLNQFEKIRHGC